MELDATSNRCNFFSYLGIFLFPLPIYCHLFLVIVAYELKPSFKQIVFLFKCLSKGSMELVTFKGFSVFVA